MELSRRKVLGTLPIPNGVYAPRRHDIPVE